MSLKNKLAKANPKTKTSSSKKQVPMPVKKKAAVAKFPTPAPVPAAVACAHMFAQERADLSGREVICSCGTAVVSQILPTPEPISTANLPIVEEPAEGVTAGPGPKRTRRTKAQMAEARAAASTTESPFARVQSNTPTTNPTQQSLLETFAGIPSDWATPPEKLPAEYIYLSQNPSLANADFYRKTQRLGQIKAVIAAHEEEFAALKLDCEMALVIAGVDKVVGAGGVKLANVKPGFSKQLVPEKLLALGVAPDLIEAATTTSPRKGYLMVTV